MTGVAGRDQVSLWRRGVSWGYAEVISSIPQPQASSQHSWDKTSPSCMAILPQGPVSGIADVAVSCLECFGLKGHALPGAGRGPRGAEAVPAWGGWALAPTYRGLKEFSRGL